MPQVCRLSRSSGVSGSTACAVSVMKLSASIQHERNAARTEQPRSRGLGSRAVTLGDRRVANCLGDMNVVEENFAEHGNTGMRIDIGIADADRREIAEGLGRVLADTYTLYLQTHNFHWNVE